MIKKRPMLSKHLAARIRGAHSRLQGAIEWKIEQDRSLLELQEKLASFDADPAAWSEKNYPKHGVSSYSVQTHIARARESLARKLARQGEVEEELKRAGENLSVVEEEVERAAMRIRATTPKEPWPTVPDGLEIQRTRILAEINRHTKHYMMEYERLKLEAMKDEAKEQARRDKEDLEARRRHVSMGPEHVILHQMKNRYIRDAYDIFKKTQDHKKALGGGWSDGLIAFVSSDHAVKAGEAGIEAGRLLIMRAHNECRSLWDICREEGFWTPDDV